ncbi:hypothetical protein [Aeromonas rivipollensis]|uniref:hypothetical protein n=1 Tax=Aeromonas rivipollensis TaxID=948519 RepID=UPI00297B351A|nr:hypothetical protein [Aeromonas rivipollensis]
MKRDEALIWEILVDTEACEDDRYEIFIDSYREKGAGAIKHHLELMKDSSLIKCTEAPLFDLISGHKPGMSTFISLTSKGHDVLAEGRKKIMNKAASYVLPMCKSVISSIIATVITNALNTPPT